MAFIDDAIAFANAALQYRFRVFVAEGTFAHALYAMRTTPLCR